MMRAQVTKLDPITVEVIGSALSTIVDQMGKAIIRAAYSANIKERRDCSAAIFDTQGRIIAQAQQIPFHLGSLLGIATETLKRTDLSTVREGDLFIGNDAHTGGGTHLNDIVFLEPAFVDGEIVAWVANLAHHSDFVDRGHAHIFQEGLRIPPVRLYREGVLQQDVMDLVLLNCQVPHERINDFRAQLAANRLGIQRFQALCARYGVGTLQRASEMLLDYAERKSRAGISAIPDGRYAFAADFDTSLWPELIPLSVTVEVAGDEIHFFVDGPPQVRAGLNLVFTMLQAAVYYVVMTLIDRDTPANAGFHRPIRITAPEGTIVNATPPAAVYARHDVAQRLIDLMFAALAQAIPERVLAGSTGVTVLTMSGMHPRTGRFSVYNESLGGGLGARAGRDGVDGIHVHGTNSANIPVEALETEHPLTVERYELVQDSGGPGRQRGGMAIRREISPVEGHEATVNLGGPLNIVPAWGLDGGHPGSLARIDLGRGARPLSARNGILKPGQTAAAVTSGGGGYGDPRQRDRELVRRDLREGRISAQAARDVYGLMG